MEGNEALKQTEERLREAESDLKIARAAEIAAENDLELARTAEHNVEAQIDEALKDIREVAERVHDSGRIQVEVGTTSGFYPKDHPDLVPETQPVEIVLEKAARELKLTNTANWIASVNKRQINPKLSYEANGLKGKVVIDWGPPAGGGGAGN